MSVIDFTPKVIPSDVFQSLNTVLNLPLSQTIQNSTIDIPDLFLQWTNHLRDELYSSKPAFLIRLSEADQKNLSLDAFRNYTVLLGRALGNLLVQNTEGDKLVTIYDRDPNRTMAQGARYHQTHEGGSIHTDNVNIPEPWQYLILSCLQPAPVGGENIIVNGDSVVKLMKKDFPLYLKVLESNYWWEKRGVSDELYEAPIVTYDKDGHAQFRHLRPYMESAHKRADQPMSAMQIKAIDILDAYLNSSDIQARFTMKAYDVLLSLDSRTLHGRTCFADLADSIIFTEWSKNPSAPKRRTMERLWIKESV